MKQVAQNYRSGAVQIIEVPTPAIRRGGVLVRSVFSVVSSGTEGMKVKEGKLSFLGKARARPDQVAKVLDSIRQQGLMSTYRKVVNKLDRHTPLGYSLSGEVIGLASDVTEFQIGDRVACGGAGYANHAEINWVPKNLVVPVPDGVKMEHAAFGTIGAIAMQAYRQSEAQLGEWACVIGLGLIGQILVQILRGAGVRVAGLDLSTERCDLALANGAAIAGRPDDPSVQAGILRRTAGAGSDYVFLVAGTSSNEPVELAARLARDRACIVDVGKTRLDLPWKEYYEKELTVRFSRSYGPGRYDPTYEEEGIDYPIGYVRWTERRNMLSFLELLAEDSVNLDSIISEVSPFAKAESVYERLAKTTDHSLGTVFRYPGEAKADSREFRMIAQREPPGVENGVRYGVIGAGSYASSMLLPNLRARPDAALVEVCTATGLSAMNALEKFGFARSGTDADTLVVAPDIDVVLIATRHASHSSLVCRALRAGKAVFVEKPLAIDLPGVREVLRTMVETGNARLLVGFNRRYSELLVHAREMLQAAASPVVMTYRVQAGQLEQSSWYLDPAQGSRFVGEAGHFLDVFAFLTGARPERVTATGLGGGGRTAEDRSNLVVQIGYDDGSVGNLVYLTQGSEKLPKEFLEVSGGRLTMQLHNFRYLEVYEGSRRRRLRTRVRDKGQAEQLRALTDAVKRGTSMPIGPESLIDTTLATLAAERSALSGQPVPMDEIWTSVEAE